MAQARAELHDLVDDLLRIQDHTLNLQVLGTYIPLLCVLLQGHPAARCLGADQELMSRSGREVPMEGLFVEEALNVGRGSIGDSEWEEAKASGQTLTAEEALVEARDAAGAVGDLELQNCSKLTAPSR